MGMTSPRPCLYQDHWTITIIRNKHTSPPEIKLYQEHIKLSPQLIIILEFENRAGRLSPRNAYYGLF